MRRSKNLLVKWLKALIFVANLCYSCDKYISVMSIESQIQKEIEKQGRGWIFFPADFSTIGQHKTVSKALEHLTDNGQIFV